MEKEATINQRVHDFSKSVDIIQTILIYLIALLVPTFLGEILKSIFPANSIVVTKSQLIIGSIVNTSLIVAAMNLKGWAKILGVITMPSVATILGGYVFKTASVFMVYMIPAIWIGNFAIVYIYKAIFVQKKKNYFLTGILGIVVKVAIIFGIFNVLKLIGIFPPKLVVALQTAMGTTQAITATVGMIIAFAIYKLEMIKK